MWNILKITLQYTMLNKLLECFQTKKLAMNTVALTHATSTVALGLLGNSNLIKINSNGYFLFDMLYILKYRNLDLMNILYLYHHMACFYFMSLDPLVYNWKNTIFIAELSNIPNYVVYYYIKKKSEDKLQFWKKIQKIWYSFFRIGVATFLTYKEVTNTESVVDMGRVLKLSPVIPLYFMGLVWSGFIVKG